MDGGMELVFFKGKLLFESGGRWWYVVHIMGFLFNKERRVLG